MNMTEYFIKKRFYQSGKLSFHGIFRQIQLKIINYNKMKRTILALSGISFILMLIISSCEKPAIEAAQEAYDYNSIYPIIQEVTGPVLPMQGRYYEFTATIRGGSTFEWESVRSAEIVPIESVESNWKTNIYFPDYIAKSESPEVIKVTETTMGGVVSEPYEYKIDSITPFTALPISGSDIVNGGFTSKYSVAPSELDKLFSTFTWTATAGEVSSPSGQPWIAEIFFSNEDVGDVVVSLIEQNAKGMKDTSHFEVTVNEYCPLDGGMNDLVGSWSGTDAWFESQITIEVSGSDLAVSGMNAGFITDWWGEEITDGGTITMTFNEDGTVEIPRQYIFTTLYDGDPYDYEIEGSGRWNNCGVSPALLITYDIYYADEEFAFPDGAGIAEFYYGYDYLPTPYMTADIVLDSGTKYARLFETIELKKPFKR